MLLCLCALLGGCSGQESRCSSLDLGSVSIGDQLIDLSRAHKAGAISREQYRDAKAELLLLMKNAARFASDTPSSYSADQDSSSDATAETDNESEQEKSGFLF